MGTWLAHPLPPAPTLTPGVPRVTVTSSRPFPNTHPPLWDTWADFFKAAEAKSSPTQGPGVLNHADFNIETHGVPPDVLCDICPFA